jgi:AcrR family transcriptional regulator
MSEVDTAAARTPGRPRSSRADAAISEAVLDLLTSGTTFEALTIEAVAARAGVGKATIYRRWANKEELLFSVIMQFKPSPTPPSGESVRADLIELLSVVGRKDKRLRDLMPCLMPEVSRNATAYRLWQDMIKPRRDLMYDVVQRGIASGELRADLDPELTVALLTAPVLVQRMLRWNPDLPEHNLPERVVDAVMAGALPRDQR